MSKYNLDKLYAILDATTTQYRKGPEVTERESGGISVTEIYAMPHVDQAPDGIIKVDVHFMTIGVDKAKAEEHRAELVEILDAYPEPESLRSGPSYITVGGCIGDQGAAFRLFALGQVLNLWRVITPRTLGIQDQQADQMAGNGYIMITGYRQD